MKIFRLAAKLQVFVYNNGITFKISKLIVGHIQRFVLGRKVTLRTLCAYDHYPRTLFMERRPGCFIMFVVGITKAMKTYGNSNTV